LESQQHQRRNNGKTSYIEKRRRRNILAQIPLLLLLSLVFFEAGISGIEEKRREGRREQKRFNQACARDLFSGLLRDDSFR
jgi:hypothetical protein